MKSIKTIALALAISTGACTMLAGGQQEQQRSLGSAVKDIFKVSASSALAYMTTQNVSYDQFVDGLSYVDTQILRAGGRGYWSRFLPKVDFYTRMAEYEDILKPAFLIGRTFAIWPAYDLYHRILTRVLG